MKKLDTTVGNLESLLHAAHQRPPGWKLRWLSSLATRRADKLSKPLASEGASDHQMHPVSKLEIAGS